MCSHTHTLCPHTPTTICVLILILPYMCPHTHANHTCVHVSSYVSSYSAYLYVSSYSYCHTCVLILMLAYMCTCVLIRVLILRTRICVLILILPYMCPHTHATIHVSSYASSYSAYLAGGGARVAWVCIGLLRLYSGSIKALFRLY